MVELAVGYVSIIPETSQVAPRLQQAFNGVSPIADRAGRDAGARFSGGLMGGLKKVGPALAGLAGVGGVAVAFKSVITTGNEFTSSMNTMRAVSTASAEDMKKVSAAARQLANDTSLPATSANDAAAAMVELSKGGFTVQQSMDAARGTLQLAAAAQIDAASAATIQSQALQAFGQNAAYAGTAADILANAANASSAEITDVASALQQSGTVANQFGLSMQDTAAAIAMMANAGIQGSDAGTLLKSALLALTDQSNPAQGAIEELGLSVYDANGQFKGMSALFGELNEASKSMTSEQYQAATATLFGSDAMRLAGIAAQQGSEGYDKMVDAMGRQGAAAEVAAARTEGLPGAWERFKNAVEDVSLSIYDSIQGPLTGALEAATGGVGSLLESARDAGPAIGEFLTKMSNGIRGAYETLRDSGKLEEWGNRLKNLWNQIGAAIDDVGPIIMQFSAIAAKAAAAMGFAAWEGLLATLEATSEILNVAVVPALQILADIAGASETATVGLVAAFMMFKMVPAVMASVRGMFAPMAAQARAATTAVTSLTTANTAVVRASQTSSVTVGRFGSAVAYLGQQSPAIGRMQSSFMNAAAGADRFGRMAGTASAAASGLRTAGSGIAGVFGGAGGLGFTAAIAGGILLMSSFQKQKAIAEEYKAALEGLSTTQQEMGSLLRKTRGEETQEVFSNLTSQVNAYTESVEAAAKADAKISDHVMDALSWGSDDSAARADAAALKAQKTRDALEQLGMTSEDVGYKIAGGKLQWQTFINQLNATGQGGKDAAAGFQELRTKFEQQQNAAKRLSPGIDELQVAMQKFSDSTSSAAEKSNALKTALDAMNPARTAQEAMSDYNDVVRSAADSMKEAADQTQGFGKELLAADGSINTATVNGDALKETLTGIVDATTDVAAKGGDMNRVNSENAKMFEDLAVRYGVSVDEIKRAADTLGLSDIDLVIRASGSGEAIEKLTAVSEAYKSIPAGQKFVEVSAGTVTEQTRQILGDLNFKVENLPNGNIKITAQDEGALPLLQQVIGKVLEADGSSAIPDIDLNKAAFDLKDAEAKAQLEGLRQQVVSPEAGLIIDNLLQGKAVSVAELAVLDQTVTNPKVDMAIDLIMQKIGLVNTELDKAAVERQVQFNITTGRDVGNIANNRGAMSELRGTGADGGFRAYANGGISSLPKSAMIQNPKANLVQWAEPETHGEAFIPLAPSKRERSLEIWRKTGELLGAKFQTFASGGIRSEDFDELAKGGFGASSPLTGATYNWAGINWGDCSAAMSAFARFAAGLPIWAGRFATGSMAGALQQMGATMGRGSSGDLRFGWYNGGEGGGHTAGTLPSGKNVEMGGSYGGGMYGGSVGADDPQFTDHAYFPAAMFGPSWTDPGSDPGGFVIRPDGTIGRAGNGNYSAGSGTETPEQRIAASISANMGNAANTAVSGQVTNMLGIIGASDSPGWLGAWSRYQQDNPVQEPSADARANGAKVTDPGMLLPAEGEDLKVKGRLYDQGGFLPPGQTLVTNNTGKPEPVLNPAQWAAIQDKRGGGEVHNHYEQINNNPVYQSESDAQKRYLDYQRRQMMRAGGR